MISGVPLFRGKDAQDQLLHILRILGTPPDATLTKMAKDSVRNTPYQCCYAVDSSSSPRSPSSHSRDALK
jgi:hypothetical protein